MFLSSFRHLHTLRVVEFLQAESKLYGVESVSLLGVIIFGLWWSERLNSWTANRQHTMDPVLKAEESCSRMTNDYQLELFRGQFG